MNRRCDTCEFWVYPALSSDNQRNEGVCRRLPPVPVFIAGTYLGMFPAIPGTAWCGEWKSKQLAGTVNNPSPEEADEK